MEKTNWADGRKLNVPNTQRASLVTAQPKIILYSLPVARCLPVPGRLRVTPSAAEKHPRTDGLHLLPLFVGSEVTQDLQIPWMMWSRDNPLIWPCRRSTLSWSLRISSHESLESLFVSKFCEPHPATGPTEQPPRLTGSGCGSGNQDLWICVSCREIQTNADEPGSQGGGE